jgi:hypothetical protein
MVGHPHIGVDRKAVLERGLDQRVAKELIVRLGGKDGLAVVAALDDVLGLAGDDVAGKTGHGCMRDGDNVSDPYSTPFIHLFSYPKRRMNSTTGISIPTNTPMEKALA